MGLSGYKGDFSLICNGLFHLRSELKHLRKMLTVVREVEYGCCFTDYSFII